MGDSLVAYAASDGSGSDQDTPAGSTVPHSNTHTGILPSVPSAHAGECFDPNEARQNGGHAGQFSNLANNEGPSSSSAPEIDQKQESEVDSALVSKLEKFKALREQGIYFNDNLVKNKSYRNPHIYTKLVQFVDVEETGTNFPPEIWNPLGFPPEAYADALRENQQKAAEMRQLAKSHGKRTGIEFEKSSSSRKIGRFQESGNRPSSDYSHDQEQARRRKERELERDRDWERDRRRGGSRSPRWPR